MADETLRLTEDRDRVLDVYIAADRVAGLYLTNPPHEELEREVVNLLRQAARALEMEGGEVGDAMDRGIIAIDCLPDNMKGPEDEWAARVLRALLNGSEG